MDFKKFFYLLKYMDFIGVNSEGDKLKDDICDFCKGVGKSSSYVCVYCNGTGEWNAAAQSYLKNHICQCIALDRKFCPICNKSCHHDTSLNPKQKIDPGNGGISVQESYSNEIMIA